VAWKQSILKKGESKIPWPSKNRPRKGRRKVGSAKRRQRQKRRNRK
jgi:hypothetical protein